MLTKDHLKKIDLAIKNRWPLRPVANDKFRNIGFQKGIKLTDKSHILTSIKALKKFPDQDSITGVAAMSPLINNFLVLDFDFNKEDDDKKHENNACSKKIKKRLSKDFDKKDLFWRKGNPKKLGQFWFCMEEKIKPSEYEIKKVLDVITTNKRVDAIGQYKGSDKISYEYPYKSPDKNTINELPIISFETFKDIIEIVEDHFNIDREDKTKEIGSRHEFFKVFLKEKIDKWLYESDIFSFTEETFEELRQTDQYDSALCDFQSGLRKTDVDKEMRSIISWCFETKVKDPNFEPPVIIENSYAAFEEQTEETYMEAEKDSVIDIIFRAVKRNQKRESTKMAFMTSLSVVSWLLSISTRYDDIAPNLLILYVAESGSGKSTSSKVINKILALDKRLMLTWGGSSIRSDSAFCEGFQKSPIRYYKFDEFSTILKGKKGQDSYTKGLAENMMQYYNDYGEGDFCKGITIREGSYGVCIDPKLSMLMFTSPAHFKEMDKDDFESGLGRRTFTIVDDDFNDREVGKEKQKEFFKEDEKQVLINFVNKYVLPMPEDDEDKDFFTMYDEVDITHAQILKQKSKGRKGDIYFEKALAPRIVNRMKETPEVNKYMRYDFISYQNKLTQDSRKSADMKQRIIVNSIGEFMNKFMTIHSLAGRKNPSLTIEMCSVEYALSHIKKYILGDLSQDIQTIYSDDNEQIDYLSKSIYQFQKRLKEKMKEDEVFTISDDIVKNFFQTPKRKKIRTEVFNNLLAKGVLIKLNKKVSKSGTKYRLNKILIKEN